ncbi:WW-domain ligand protein [Geosmithia morbida]|uniref:WW-domain ligand protein n=1 Tax=Geosmithia morbida TaxID=1094350 RepID=A0A9P4YVZ4_9HYPO|nr:WW-domain ligand protein [Geosmithia morbida]KAF4122812.1 WW-domain ligand protein [Geosmithia morbida]
MDNPHDYLITTSPRSRPVDPDNATSWVMLNQSGFVKLGNERILQKLDSRISCELSVPTELKTRCAQFHRKSDRGTLFLTNKRIVYLPAKRDQEPKFESFSAPILKFQDSTTSSSMWWGWVWKSDCIPVSGGGIPPDIPRIEVRFTFSDGGMMDFNETYIRLRERLYQFHEMRREMGAGADVPDEPLPAYEEQPSSSTTGPQSIAAPASAASAAAAIQNAQPQTAPSTAGRRPDEPPPGYDEAQAQQISIQLEDHIRDGANRGDNA